MSVVVVLVAGSPAAAQGADGFVYVLRNDTMVNGGSRIYGFRVDPATGLTALSGFPVPTGGDGLAVGGVSEGIVVDRANRRLYALNLNSRTVSAFSIAPMTGALTALPFSAISLGAAPSTEIVQCLAVHPSGSPLVVASRFTEPNGQLNGRAYSFNVTATSATAAVGSPYLTGADTHPQSCEFSRDGASFYSGGYDGQHFAGFAVNASTGVLTPLAGSPFLSGDVTGSFATDESGRLFAADLSETVRAYTTSAGIPTEVSSATSGLFGVAWDGLLHPAGFYIVASSSGFGTAKTGVYRIQGSGAGTTLQAVPGSPFESTDGSPLSLALDQTGTLLFLANATMRNVTTFTVNGSTGALAILNTQPANTLGATGDIGGIAWVPMGGVSPGADLVLTKSGAPTPVLPGGTVTYTLTVTNAGSEAASSVVVSDTLPASLSFVACTVTTGVCGGSGNARTITIATLAPGASSAITLVASVSASPGAGGTISNTATVTSATPDPAPANNSATANVSTLAPSGDADADGLTDGFETQFGLNPFSGSGENGAAGDPDGDGRTNLQEQVEGTHPRGFVTTYLAEGATGNFFDTRLAVANPTSSPALVLTRFQKSDGTTIRDYRVIAPMQRTTIDVETLAGLEAAEFSTLVEADVQVVADRTMTWGEDGYGSHAERGIPTRTASTWYFAEGATFGNFNLFYLIQNPSAQAAHVQVTYLLPAPAAPLVKQYVVNPQSRFNIWVDHEGITDPALAPLAAAELSAIIKSINGVPIIAERAMYLDQPGRVFGAGHESAGVTAPSTRWFLAEGATGEYFDLFILIANPQAAAAAVQADFLLVSGQVITKTYSVPGNSRFNIWVDLEDPVLADAAVSTRITSTNGVPIIVERAMWWPGPTADTWQEAHNSPGEVRTGTRWAIAEGEIGGPRNTETYVLIANTSAFNGTARVTLLFEDGTAPVIRTFPLTANSRSNVAVAFDFPETVGKRFGMLIETIGETPAQIVVERAMYSDGGGVHWAAGTNALATRLQ